MNNTFEIIWSSEALKQSKKIKKQKDREKTKKYLMRISELLEDIQEDPFTGKGKPEHLRYVAPSCWSRRITQRDRLVYRIVKDEIQVVSILGHYSR